MNANFQKINELYEQKIPFFFVINYDKTEIYFDTLENSKHSTDIFIQTSLFSNVIQNNKKQDIELTKHPIPFNDYQQAFENVLKEIKLGNSYLTNLTFETPIELNVDLKTVFFQAKAKYKLYFKNQFVSFSPESFIKIEDNYIRAFPMKGTIDAHLPNAEKLIIENEKEKAEHYTIVDLLRNDLSKVAEKVSVNRFRYIEKISTEKGEILQVSSEIEGKISPEFQTKLGTLLNELLPAGSICGAPKEKTLEIISETEMYKRGFYSGIFGVFDGKKVDTAVLIRFIENKNGNYFYKSGGGITHQSNAEEEYNELIQKIYVPVF